MQQMRIPLLEARATLLPEANRPRLVPGWRPAIAPIMDNGEPDMSAPVSGIGFTSGPGEAAPGSTFFCAFRLLAWPDPLCDRFAVGIRFAFLEGASVVGTGEVLPIGHADGA